MKDVEENIALIVYGVKYIYKPYFLVVGKDGIIRSLGNCEDL